MTERFLITSKKTMVPITSNNVSTINHFNDPNCYTDTILDHINNQVTWDFYFQHEVNRYRRNLVVLDIGANIGLFSIYAHDSADKVIAVEPTPEHLNILKELTNNYKNIIIEPGALADNTGTLEFYISDENSTMNSTVNTYNKSVTVNSIRLDDLIKKYNLSHVDFCKMDIEGSEFQAITAELVNAMSDVIENWHIEVHATPGRSIEENINYFLDMFNSNGYVAQRISYDGIFAQQRIYVI